MVPFWKYRFAFLLRAENIWAKFFNGSHLSNKTRSEYEATHVDHDDRDPVGCIGCLLGSAQSEQRNRYQDQGRRRFMSSLP